MKRKILVAVSLFLVLSGMRAGFHTTPKRFYLRYSIIGFGSNMFIKQPVFTILDSTYKLTSEQMWVRDGKKKEEPILLYSGTLGPQIIDSIICLIEPFEGKKISDVNICVLSGVGYDLEAAVNTDTAKFWLHNTYDSTVLKVISIINNSLPESYKLMSEPDFVNEKKKCMEYLKK